MTQQRQTIFQRVQQMPPLVRWGIYAGLALLVFLVWADYVAPVSERYKVRAEQLSNDLRIVRDTRSLNSEIQQLSSTIEGIGAVERPRPAATGETALTRAVNEVLKDYNITNDSFGVRVRGALRSGSLPGLTGTGQAHILSGDLRFNAPPEVAMAIVAGLEARPEIEALSQVNFTRIAGRRVSVQITMESWVLPDESRRRGGSI